MLGTAKRGVVLGNIDGKCCAFCGVVVLSFCPMRKLLQFKLYSFLSSKWGMTFCVVGLFVTLNAFFQIVQLLLNPPTGICYNIGIVTCSH